MTTILLARHGETDWNRDYRWQGHSDPPLNERGREQARVLAARLAGTPLDAVYASDLRRALETAEIVAAELGLPVTLVPALREINAGSWEGLTAEEIERREPELYARWVATGDPGWQHGETHAALAERVYQAVFAIADRHRGGRVLVVCHGGPMKAVLMRAEGLDFPAARRSTPPIGNCELCRVAVEDGDVRRID